MNFKLISVLLTNILLCHSLPHPLNKRIDESLSGQGDVTYYGEGGSDPAPTGPEGGSPGACGVAPRNNKYFAALNYIQYGEYSNPNNSVVCRRCVKVKYGSNEVVVEIVDKCPVCQSGDIDLSPTAFTELFGSLDVGRVHNVNWNEVSCDELGVSSENGSSNNESIKSSYSNEPNLYDSSNESIKPSSSNEPNLYDSSNKSIKPSSSNEPNLYDSSNESIKPSSSNEPNLYDSSNEHNSSNRSSKYNSSNRSNRHNFINKANKYNSSSASNKYNSTYKNIISNNKWNGKKIENNSDWNIQDQKSNTFGYRKIYTTPRNPTTINTTTSVVYVSSTYITTTTSTIYITETSTTYETITATAQKYFYHHK
ncbi:hypothetical protein BCR36DRAFT_580713 [Piromyces finnis]|uniref:RlpA-like protein double-psi beta-barrel domain-containing protein n=1 Tax=Piromyces finnis TaxID=1754191 RepID=A0A1Y1VIS5_9FUNG|nr:hypothetical protein BCR36DRAFT_580713 [Piromyces finnis]|eukprot:ORX57303.1 hypothetical protein BCR36DRAFT_580713 [Piromyces finnis]